MEGPGNWGGSLGSEKVGAGGGQDGSRGFPEGLFLSVWPEPPEASR